MKAKEFVLELFLLQFKHIMIILFYCRVLTIYIQYIQFNLYSQWIFERLKCRKNIVLGLEIDWEILQGLPMLRILNVLCSVQKIFVDDFSWDLLDHSKHNRFLKILPSMLLMKTFFELIMWIELNLYSTYFLFKNFNY